jgi:hypothetical protein
MNQPNLAPVAKFVWQWQNFDVLFDGVTCGNNFNFLFVFCPALLRPQTICAFVTENRVTCGTPSSFFFYDLSRSLLTIALWALCL